MQHLLRGIFLVAGLAMILAGFLDYTYQNLPAGLVMPGQNPEIGNTVGTLLVAFSAPTRDFWHWVQESRFGNGHAMLAGLGLMAIGILEAIHK